MSKCEQANCNNNYFNELQRTYQVSELLRTKHSFKCVGVGYAQNASRTIEVTFDGVVWKVLKIYADSTDWEILETMQHALSTNKFDDEYKLNSNTIVLNNIIDTYGLRDCDYQIIRNTLCKLNYDAGSVSFEEVVDTSQLKGISLDFDDNNIEKLTLTTNDGQIVINCD